MTRSTKGFSLVLAGLLLLSVLSSAASAAPVSAGSGGDAEADESDSSVWTKVTLHVQVGRRAARFAGAVLSEDECSSGRKVTLFHVTRSGRSDPVATTYSGSYGDYHLKLGGGANGRYYTKAARAAVADAYGDLLYCEADLSSIVRI